MSTATLSTRSDPTTTGGGDRVWLVLLSMLSVQLGAGFAARLMVDLGAPAVVMIRQGGAAVLLLLLSRPRIRGRQTTEIRAILGLGAVLAVMNCAFYSAVERLPLAVAVTVELIGPLGLAAALSRRMRDLVWVAVAMVGVVVLGDPATGLDTIGLVLAVCAAACWAAYILLSSKVGRHSEGVGSLGLAMTVAALLVAPVGLGAGSQLVTSRTLLLGIAVAVLAGLVPFSLELIALRRVPARVFGVLMSLSPVAAVLSGMVLLGQAPSRREILAMCLVMVASVATVRGDRRGAQSITATSAGPASSVPSPAGA